MVQNSLTDRAQYLEVSFFAHDVCKLWFSENQRVVFNDMLLLNVNL